MDASRITRAVNRLRYGPRIPVTAGGLTTIRLGSQYGGWHLCPTPELEGGVVLSCGLGEDASFDVELASRFGCRVIVVDPTPRAVRHFEELMDRCGLPAELPYTDDGKQDVRSYDLTEVTSGHMVLVDKALADVNGMVRFYAPKSDSDVSHSIVNFQNEYSTETSFIEVQAIDITSLLGQQDVAELALAKFDIEGAEILVLPQMLGAGILPSQLLVEFDELNWPSRASRDKFDSVHKKILAAGYEVTHFDGRSCVSYLRP